MKANSVVHYSIYGVWWWSLVISKQASELIHHTHRESYFVCWWSRRYRRKMSKSKSLQIQTTGCVITKTDTQKKWLKLVHWSEVDIGNKHLENTIYLDQASDSKRKILLFILALNHCIYLFKMHRRRPNWLTVCQTHSTYHRGRKRTLRKPEEFRGI